MKVLECKNFGFSYPGSQTSALDGINLTIDRGEFVVICGSSGSGKSTLLQNIKKEIQPIGQKWGDIVHYHNPNEHGSKEVGTNHIGMVFQDPEVQIVMDTVLHELAFSLENHGISPTEIKKRIYEMAQYFGIEYLLQKQVKQLSGGQKQLVNICSVLLLKPTILLLDEPTAQLDPIAANELIQLLYRLSQDFYITILLSEHRLEQVFSLADRIVLLEEGRIVRDLSPRLFLQGIDFTKMSLETHFIPSEIRMMAEIEQRLDGILTATPVTIRDCKTRWKAIFQEGRFLNTESLLKVNEKNIDKKIATPVLRLKEVSFQYQKDQHFILSHLSLQVYEGEILAMMGSNGAGKSTILQIMAGILSPDAGKVYLDYKAVAKKAKEAQKEFVGYVAQNPILHFISDTVLEELRSCAISERHLNTENFIREVIQRMSLQDILDRHPYDLSGGQQQRLAIALSLFKKPKILLLDEPTKGLDPIAKADFANVLKELKQSGVSIVIATHDIEFAAANADRCTLVMHGECIVTGEPTQFFSENYFYTTCVNRLVREELPYAIHSKDVLNLCFPHGDM